MRVMCIDLACITNQSSGRAEKEGGACADIRMYVAGVMVRDCSEGGACRAALQPQTHNFLSLQCTNGTVLTLLADCCDGAGC